MKDHYAKRVTFDPTFVVMLKEVFRQRQRGRFVLSHKGKPRRRHRVLPKWWNKPEVE